MEYKHIFNFNIKWNYKSIFLFLILLILPNYIGLFGYTTIFGLRIHFFQIMIFLAAMIYGPLGGALSGAIGSVYVAIMLSNPYIILGNVILGFFTGVFYRIGIYLVLAVLFAYLIQLPWLYFSDVYLMKMPNEFVLMIIISLLISDLVWAFIALLIGKKIKDFLC